MYMTATFLGEHFWGQPSRMADSLGVLLLTWHQAFYRYGIFDFGRLERAIEKTLPVLDTFRRRDISTYIPADDRLVRSLFRTFVTALQIREGPKRGQRSPVAAAKALHLLAPRYFPLWDEQIARAYDCYYKDQPATRYLDFMRIVKRFSDALASRIPADTKPFTKLLDEYNYARFTKRWI